METNNQERSQDGVADQDEIYKFKEVRGNQELTHTINLLECIGSNAAGVYIAQAIQSNCEVTDPLFHDGKRFVLKIFRIEAAEDLCDRWGVDLSDELIASYLEMKANGRLQSYIDFLSSDVELSDLPVKVREYFDPSAGDRDTVTRSEIAQHIFDDFEYSRELISICIDAQLMHPEQDTPPYLLALATYHVFTARHKEFAVHLFIQQNAANCGLAPSLIGFLKMDTKSPFHRSLVTDAVAMELFDGASWLNLRESVEAQTILAPLPTEHLSRYIQDAIQLASCLLPLGLQQVDNAGRNIFARFDAESGYITSSWIDLEGFHPIQGNKQARRHLETYLDALLKQQNSYPHNHFRLSLNALRPHLASAEPNLRMEEDLRLSFY